VELVQALNSESDVMDPVFSQPILPIFGAFLSARHIWLSLEHQQAVSLSFGSCVCDRHRLVGEKKSVHRYKFGSMQEAGPLYTELRRYVTDK
jgi:hypothetical protein